MIPENLTFDSLLSYMESCEQTSGLNMIQHGMMVNQKYNQIVDCIKNEKPFPDGWRIPEYTKDLLPHLLNDTKIISDYQIFHDCGKPFCLEIDENGKRHFPNHAEVSYHTWLKIGGNEQTAKLIKMDMDIHLLKADGIEEFSSRPEWATLILTGIAEVHANAEMFGGFDSNSFKIKIKQITKRGKQILEKRKIIC